MSLNDVLAIGAVVAGIAYVASRMSNNPFEYAPESVGRAYADQITMLAEQEFSNWGSENYYSDDAWQPETRNRLNEENNVGDGSEGFTGL